MRGLGLGLGMRRRSTGSGSLLDGLRFAYELADTSDSSGRGNTLTNVNSTTFTAGGKPGNCSTHVAASLQYFTRADGADMRFGAKDWSVSGWFNVTTDPARDIGILCKDSVSSNREFAIIWISSTDSLQVFVFDGATALRGSASTSANTASVGAWHHVVVTYSLASNLMSVYVDNGSAFTLTPSGALGSGTAPVHIGGQNALSTRMHEGGLDSWYKWDRVVTAAERTSLYNSSFGLAVAGLSSPGNSVLPWMTAYWDLANVNDSHVNAYTLTNVNTVTFPASDGKPGAYGQFVSASTQYLTIADNADLSGGDVDMAFSAWARMDTLGAQRTVFGKWGTAGNREYILIYNASSQRFEWYVSAAGTTSTAVQCSSVIPATGTWYHFFCGHDATLDQIFLQVNGGTIHVASHPGGVFDSTSVFSIGRNLDAAGGYQNGRIDSMAAWRSAAAAGALLTAQKTAFLRNGTTGRAYSEIY